MSDKETEVIWAIDKAFTSIFNYIENNPLPEVLGVFCPYRPMLVSTPGHGIYHRASSLEMDLLQLPAGQQESVEFI